MGRHFTDARYHLGQAFDHLKAGATERVSAARNRAADVVRDDEEPEPSRLDRVRARFGSAKGTVREFVTSLRERVAGLRSRTETKRGDAA